MEDRSKIIRVSDEEEATFLRLEGHPLRSGTELEPFVRPGLDGISFRDLGKHGRPFTLIGLRDYESLTDAVNDGVSMTTGLKGQLCHILDSAGVTHQDMVCLDVRPRKPTPVLLMVGGLTENPACLAECEFDFVYRA